MADIEIETDLSKLINKLQLKWIIFIYCSIFIILSFKWLLKTVIKTKSTKTASLLCPQDKLEPKIHFITVWGSELLFII